MEPVHCQHRLACPVCLSAEVRRLQAELGAERSRVAYLEKVVQQQEQRMRRAGLPISTSAEKVGPE